MWLASFGLGKSGSLAVTVGHRWVRNFPGMIGSMVPVNMDFVPTLGVPDEEECIKWGECDSNNPTLALNKVY